LQVIALRQFRRSSTKEENAETQRELIQHSVSHNSSKELNLISLAIANGAEYTTIESSLYVLGLDAQRQAVTGCSIE